MSEVRRGSAQSASQRHPRSIKVSEYARRRSSACERFVGSAATFFLPVDDGVVEPVWGNGRWALAERRGLFPRPSRFACFLGFLRRRGSTYTLFFRLS